MLRQLTIVLALVILTLVVTPAALAKPQIIINKSTNQLSFYQDDKLVKMFPVATGKHPSLTPEGNFSIVAKVVNPYYGKLNIPGGSPNNPLGVRWLGLSIGGGSVYGIHGNNNPASIGTYASAGCIRMHNQDVIWLYDRVPLGTRVQIISQPGSRPVQPKPTLPAPEPIHLAVNGQQLELPIGQRPFLLEGRSYVPLRPVARQLNYHLNWDDESSGVMLTGGGHTVLMHINQHRVDYNGQARQLEHPPLLSDSVTFIPTSLLRDILALEVVWDHHHRVVHVSGANPAQTGLPRPAVSPPELLTGDPPA